MGDDGWDTRKPRTNPPGRVGYLRSPSARQLVRKGKLELENREPRRAQLLVTSLVERHGDFIAEMQFSEKSQATLHRLHAKLPSAVLDLFLRSLRAEHPLI
jgi:hypothetical protein